MQFLNQKSRFFIDTYQTRALEQRLLAITGYADTVLGTSAFDPKQTFPDCLKRDLDPLIPYQSIAGLAVQFTSYGQDPRGRVALFYLAL